MWFLGDAMWSCSPFVVMALRNWEHAKIAHQHMLVSEVKHAQKEDLAFQRIRIIMQTQWHRVLVAFYSKHHYVDIMTYSYAYLNVFAFFVHTNVVFLPILQNQQSQIPPKTSRSFITTFHSPTRDFRSKKVGAWSIEHPETRWPLWNKTALWVGLKSFSGGLVYRYTHEINLTQFWHPNPVSDLWTLDTFHGTRQGVWTWCCSQNVSGKSKCKKEHILLKIKKLPAGQCFLRCQNSTNFGP